MEGHTVRTFDGDILTLRMHVLAMGGLGIDQVQRAVHALVRRDDEAAREVIGRGAQVSGYGQSIEEEIIGLIARRQPVASDLKAILAIGRVATDIERVGNAARKIARLSIELNSSGERSPLPHLYNDVRKMSRLAVAMLREALDAFDRVDLERASATAERDLELDAEFQLALRELVTYVMEDPRHLKSTVHTVFLLKALERVGDHARSIAASVPKLARREEAAVISAEPVPGVPPLASLAGGERREPPTESRLG